MKSLWRKIATTTTTSCRILNSCDKKKYTVQSDTQSKEQLKNKRKKLSFFFISVFNVSMQYIDDIDIRALLNNCYQLSTERAICSELVPTL